MDSILKRIANNLAERESTDESITQQNQSMISQAKQVKNEKRGS